jgi:hypothetical protein
MSDFQAPSTSPTTAFSPESQFDVGAVDRNFRAISSIESTWRLPQLPDEVKLDLASTPGVDEQSLTELLFGIDSDLNEEDEPEQEPDYGISLQPRSTLDEFRVVSAGVTGSPHPTDPSVDAVKAFKRDAIRRGLLEPPEGGQLDSNWSPELNQVRREMVFDDYNQRLRGDRPGAVPTNRVLELVGDWTQPTGLLAAATELDLWWDTGAISDEFSTWGAKWRKLADSSNPLEFAGNLIDAVTGPIDDIVFPALNIALLATGVGGLANAGRIGVLGARAATGGRALRGLYSLAAPGSLARIGEASWTANRLIRAGGARGAVGEAMAAWRAIPAVRRTKQTVGLGMRAGFVSQAQDLFPGYQGGQSLAGSIPGVEQLAGDVRDFGLTSLLSTPIELAFAPYNIFNPGTFFKGGLATSAAQGFLAAGGSLPGRAAIGGVLGAGAGALAGDDTGDVLEGLSYGALGGALLPRAGKLLARSPLAANTALGAGIGAGVAVVTDADPTDAVMFGAVTGASIVGSRSVWGKLPNPGKYVGYAGDVVSRFSYKPIAEDQRVTVAFQKGLKPWLDANPELAQRFQADLEQSNSFLTAFARLTGTDEEGAAAAMSYVMVAAAIDYTAAVQAGKAYGEKFHLFRNKLISQLRTFDLNGNVTPEEVARAIAIDQTAGADYTKRFEKVLESMSDTDIRPLVEAHNQVAEDTLRQLMSIENLPDIGRSIKWSTELDAEGRLGVLEAYIPQVMDSFGNWSRFTEQSDAVEGWINAGFLDGAEFLPVRTPWGSTRSPKAHVYKRQRSLVMTDERITDTLIRDPQAATRTRGRLTPLARTQPTGRFTIAKQDTITKQFLEEEALELEELLNASEKLRHLKERGVWGQIKTQLGGGTLAGMEKDALKDFIRVSGFAKNSSQLRALHSFMRRHGISDDELGGFIDDLLTQYANDTQRWTGLGLDPIVRHADGNVLHGPAALKARVGEIREKARFTAAELDLDSVLTHVRATQGDEAANELVQELDLMRTKGYKLVHGVEYLMPQDLGSKTALFRDIGTRELNFSTMGNSFRRRHPAVARASQERRERAAIVQAFDSHRLANLTPDDPMVDQALFDLRQILNEIQDPLAQRTEELHLLSFWERKRLALDSSFAPLRVEDLSRRREFVVDRLLKAGWEPEQANAIFASIRQFRNTEFKDLGLYAFEAKMRSRNELVQVLKFLGGTKYSDGLFTPGRTGAAVGAFAGQDALAGAADPGAGTDEMLGRRVAGLVGGAVAGAAVGRFGAQAAAAGTSQLMTGTANVSEAILRAEQRPAFMLTDKLVRLRDGLRFSLSPLFDVSRYTEGLVLSQVGTPLRLSDGTRATLPLNMTPSAVKKRIGRDGFREARAQFRQIAMGRGHGDVDVLDDAGHWFAQIGIMGFNPQEWQVGAFAELKRAGFSVEEAYEAARETYTYGTRGRSAAELSTNFVFFPFSFQKKALGHVAKWVNDDLSRSIMIHDGFKAYEALNERYDLDQMWKDYLPAFEMLQRLNLLAYGVSPGRFGGINSQLFETAGKSLVLFTPWGGQITDKSDYIELQKLVRSVTPAINDINWMMQDLKDQGSVLFSESHKSRLGQIREGYAEWNQFRDELGQALEDQGWTWSDLQRSPYLEDQKLAYEAKRADLAFRLPEWSKSRRESIFNVQALEMERNDLMAVAMADPASATPQAVMVAQFENELAQVKEALDAEGVSVDGPDGWLDAPGWASQYLIERAVQMREADPRFYGVWKKFYERELGPIEAPV